MRVTNNMMRNNSTLNMQKNKVAYDKYLQQYTTQKKIQRPSDDPTIAVRALKYRTTISEIDQYLKNIEDATSWMDATETVLKDIDKRLDTMVDVCTEAATGTVNAKNRENLVKQLREMHLTFLSRMPIRIMQDATCLPDTERMCHCCLRKIRPMLHTISRKNWRSMT